MQQPREISPPLVLASTSPFRRALLEKLGIAFSTRTPGIDESPNVEEDPQRLVMRLSLQKARAVGNKFPRALVIGSDQVACIDDAIMGKPGNRQGAIAQLKAASGRRVDFYTGLSLLNTATGREQTLCEPFSVYFRPLQQDQIERYLDAEQPYDCAGSFKSEGLGIVLFERLQGDDPNALIGLPLIRLVEMLRNEGIQIP
ncbi:MAG: septum formation inhibitor Maf [Gammaproteobacteria bacterium]|nr:septum formation inhibitor Maf [Gammaproteobacteria bacterium]HXK56865.1 nucleoside triphosphate pyrophosphatase [Gammaproteobacteria bacterium]